MSRQQEVLFFQSKFTDNFVLGTTPIYKLGPGKLLVRNKAASLNPVDWKVQKHGMFVENYPAIVGVDITGDVEEVGEGVTLFSKGNSVRHIFRWHYNINTLNNTPTRGLSQG